MTTIGDVAKRARVSKTTVSRYLNGKLEHMSEATRQRVEESIAALHYRPSLLASGLRTKQTLSIGVVVSNITNAFFAHLVHEIERIANSKGYHVILCNTADEPGVELECINVLISRQVEGLILTTSGGNAALLSELADRQYPLVLLDRGVAGLMADLVSLDNDHAARLAVEHLVDLGHERIGVLAASPLELTPRTERVDAYKNALIARGFEVDPNLIWVGPPTRAGGYEGLEALLALPNPPTALVCTVNVLALGVLEACRNRKLRIPDELSIVSFDDVDWTSVVEPPLTVIAQPVHDLAHAAVQRLFLRMGADDAARAERIAMRGKLIERSSTAAPKASHRERARDAYEA